MTAKTMKIANMLDMLPDDEQDLALNLLERIILAWDPDYTKLTLSEKKELEEAENDEFIDQDNIDWENLKSYM